MIYTKKDAECIAAAVTAFEGRRLSDDEHVDVFERDDGDFEVRRQTATMSSVPTLVKKDDVRLRVPIFFREFDT